MGDVCYHVSVLKRPARGRDWNVREGKMIQKKEVYSIFVFFAIFFFINLSFQCTIAEFRTLDADGL